MARLQWRQTHGAINLCFKKRTRCSCKSSVQLYMNHMITHWLPWSNVLILHFSQIVVSTDSFVIFLLKCFWHNAECFNLCLPFYPILYIFSTRNFSVIVNAQTSDSVLFCLCLLFVGNCFVSSINASVIFRLWHFIFLRHKWEKSSQWCKLSAHPKSFVHLANTTFFSLSMNKINKRTS